MNKTWFACADYSWPKLTHDTALALIRGMGFTHVDLGAFYDATHIKPEEIIKDVDGSVKHAADLLEKYELEVGDVFLIPGIDFETRAPNNQHPDQIADAINMFTKICEFTSKLGGSGVTVLPGNPRDGEHAEEAIGRSVKTLKNYVGIADSFGLEVSFEPHNKSCTPSPALAAQLVELVDGLKITLDSGHFEYANHPVSSYGDMFKHVRHVQLRGAASGNMQAIFPENTTDFAMMIDKLFAGGYEGGFACEYVWTPGWECRRVDNVSETVLLFDHVKKLVEQQR